MITIINDNFINVIPTLNDESVSLFLIGLSKVPFGL